MPLKVSGMTSQSGRRNGAVSEDHDPDRKADHREHVEQRREAQIGDDVGQDRDDQDRRHDDDAASIRSSRPRGASLMIGE